jgi:lincosamide nucleotidyltransferase A/C/D/E
VTEGAQSRVRRSIFRLMRLAAAALGRTPLRRVLETGAVGKLRLAAGREMPAHRVRDVADALDQAGVRWWLAGGWGVDALVGHQTRQHGDLDVVVDGDERDVDDRVRQALALIGLDRAGVESSIAPLRVSWVHSDGAGTTVEVLPADLHSEPFDQPAAFARGSVEGREVPCLSVAAQVRLRRGFRHRSIDRYDMARLTALDMGDNG